MPVIQSRSTPSVRTPDSPLPRQVVQAQPTGMSIEKPNAESGQTPVVEATKDKAVTLSPQLTALARKEQKLRQQEQAFKAEKAALEAERVEIANLKNFKSKLSAKDYSALDEAGVSYEEWTNYLINKGESEKPETQALKKLEAEIQSLKSAQEQSVNKQYEATVNQYKKEIASLIQTSPEFESVKELKAEEHVLQHILDTFNQDGEILSVEQAAKEVEEALVEEAMNFAKLKKVQDKLKPAQPEKQLPPPSKSIPKTLTNQAAVAAPSAPRNQFQHLSMKERIAQAVARAQTNKG